MSTRPVPLQCSPARVWDIRDRIAPHTDTARITAAHWQDVEQRAIVQANFMIFLLEDIPFATYYYADMRQWLPRCIERVEGCWPDHPDFTDDLQALASLYLQLVATRLDHLDEPFQFGDLWVRHEERRSTRLDYEALAAPFYSLVQHPDCGDAFLFPFVKLDAQRRLVSRAQMDEHVEAIGPCTLREFFDLPHTLPANSPGGPVELTGHGQRFKRAKRYAILFGGARETQTPFGGGGGSNFRQCGSTGCVSAPAGWCSLDSYGRCVSG